MLYMLFGLIWPLIYGFCMLGVGTVAVSNHPIVMHIVAYCAAVMIPLRGLYYIAVDLIKGNGVTRGLIIQTAAEILMAALIVALPNFSYGAFAVVFEIFLSFYIGVKLVDTAIYWRGRIYKFMIPSLAQAVLFLHIFAAVLFIPGEIRRRAIEIGIGAVMSAFGAAHICDFLTTIVKKRRAREILGYIRITMPGLIAISIPHRIMHCVRNARLRSADREINAEVFFLYGKGGIEIAGHCEICLDGRTYTYGNYDPASRKLFGTVGGGVIIRAERNSYIDWCVGSNRKMMMVYGLHFNENELAEVRRRAEEFDACLAPWDVSVLPEKEYVRKLSANVDARTYRIEKGRFSTYFIPTINCVKLVDYFLGDTAIGHTFIPGIKSPGAYMDVLQRLYDTGSETVVSLKTYGIK